MIIKLAVMLLAFNIAFSGEIYLTPGGSYVTSDRTRITCNAETQCMCIEKFDHVLKQNMYALIFVGNGGSTVLATYPFYDTCRYFMKSTPECT